ncbi:MAG: LEPR-XLL domain-containing protein, partial [Actinomycetia bacterium]|nr:LEPR-XLL domain-containing protein [Actinomycetes bacterium]
MGIFRGKGCRRSTLATSVSRGLRAEVPAPRRFIFEALEPRYLLSADLLPVAPDPSDGRDLSLRYEETTQTIQLIEERRDGPRVVDAWPSNQAAGGATGSGKSLAAAPVISIQTGDGDDTLLIDGIDLDGLVFTLDTGAGDDRILVSNSRFEGSVVRFDGGSGDDTLSAYNLGGQADTDWRIDSDNAGSVQGLSFTGMENLLGGSDNRDLFIVAPGADVDGVIDGGAGGDDRLIIEDDGLGPRTLSHSITGPQHGTLASSDGNIAHDYGGFERVEQSTLSDSQTITLSKDANLTLAQTQDGDLVAMIQHAFDADTDLDALTGDDGFVLTGADGSLGQAVSAAGDVNADGFDDLILGAPAQDLAYVLFGTDQGFDASLDLTTLDGTNGFVLTGPAGQNLGYSVGGGGDVNGDGVDDLILGAPGPTASFGAGVSYVLFGTATGFAASLAVTALDGSNGFALTGLADGDASGFSVVAVSFANRDFISDILIGAPGADPDPTLVDAGQAYLVFGTDQGFDAKVQLSSLDGKIGFALDGAAAGDAAGHAVASAGDLNSDGVGDVVVGAPGADANGEGAGAAYVFFGAADFAVAEGLSGLFYDTGPITSLADAQTAITSAVPTATFLAYQIDYPNSDAADTVDATTGLDDFLGLNAEEIVGGDSSTIDGSVFTFDGFLHVAEAGTYQFEVGSAEGFTLTVDGATVAELDGTPGFTLTPGSHTFATAGFYAIDLLYYTDDDPSGIELKSDLVTTDGTLDFITREQLFTAPAIAAFGLGALDGASGFALVGAAAGDALGTAVGHVADLNE